MGRLARIAATLKQKYREEKASLEGKAISRARMIKSAKDIPQIEGYLTPGTPQAIPGANITMSNKQPMTFFTDGSLRNGFGPKPADLSGRQRRKLRKNLRRARMAKKGFTMRTVPDDTKA